MNPQPQARATAADIEPARPKRCEALLASSDDGWLIELGPMLGDRFRTFNAERVSDLEAAASQHPRALAIIDEDSLREVRPAIARLEQQRPELQIIVVGRQPDAWGAAVSRGTILAAVAREEMGGAGMQEALAKAEARLRRAPDQGLSRPGAVSPVQPARQRTASLALLGGAIALALCAALAGWLLHRSTRGPAVPAAAGTAAPASLSAAGKAAPSGGAAAVSDSVLNLLSAARVAFAHGQLLPGVPHSGTSALELYDQVLALMPTNAEALDGVHRLFRVALAQAQADVAAGRLGSASALLADFKSAQVDAQALRSAQASIAAARPKWLVAGVKQRIAAGDLQGAGQQLAQLAGAGVDPATIASLKAAIASGEQQLQLTKLSTAVGKAIRAGTLLKPAHDNARTRLQAMQQLSSTDPQTLAAAQALQKALLARATQALHGAQPANARPYLAAADAIGKTAEASRLESQLQHSLTLAAARAAAARKQRQAALAAQAAAHARRHTAPPAAPAGYIAARPLEPLQVTYPPEALDDQLPGTVIVEFWLQPNGTAADAHVVTAQPAGLFDRAAVQAVLRGHYATSALQRGAPRLARIKIVFRPG